MYITVTKPRTEVSIILISGFVIRVGKEANGCIEPPLLSVCVVWKILLQIVWSIGECGERPRRFI